MSCALLESHSKVHPTIYTLRIFAFIIQPTFWPLTFIPLAGDPRILSAALVEAYSRFNSNRSLPRDSPEVEQKILEAREVARILRENVVQGQHVTGSGDDELRYRAYNPFGPAACRDSAKGKALARFSQECRSFADVWGCAELRIHNEIERGDNESIKKGSDLTSSGGGSCAGAS